MGPAPPDLAGGPRSLSREAPRSGSPRQPGTPEKSTGEGGVKPSPPGGAGLPVSGASLQTAPSFRILSEQLARSLGIPQDALSSRLVSFLRYFSLPLDGDLIAGLRREVLAFRVAGKPTEGGTKGREAAALGAAAAADKGVVLSPEALAEYAAAIDPEGGQSGEGEFDREPGNSPGQDYPADQDKRKKESPNSGEDREDSLETGALRKKIQTPSEHRPLLDLLNRLPGRDGRRWMVFPFAFTSGDVALKVSLRILLSNPEGGHEEARLVLDIRSERGGWVFCLSGYGTPRSRADISLYPPQPRRSLKNLEGEFRELLGDFVREIYVENREGPFLAEEENRTILFSINEKI